MKLPPNTYGPAGPAGKEQPAEIEEKIFDDMQSEKREAFVDGFARVVYAVGTWMKAHPVATAMIASVLLSAVVPRSPLPWRRFSR